MSDYISRQAAINVLERKKDKNAKGDIARFYNTIIQNDIDALMQLPSAQQEIIRCKDCKWFDNIGCAIEIVESSDKPDENDFCSFAERKTDG